MKSFHIATEGRPGPVLIDLPKDVSSADCTASLDNVEMDLPGFKPDITVDHDGVQALADALKGSKSLCY